MYESIYITNHLTSEEGPKRPKCIRLCVHVICTFQLDFFWIFKYFKTYLKINACILPIINLYGDIWFLPFTLGSSLNYFELSFFPPSVSCCFPLTKVLHQQKAVQKTTQSNMGVPHGQHTSQASPPLKPAIQPGVGAQDQLLLIAEPSTLSVMLHCGTHYIIWASTSSEGPIQPGWKDYFDCRRFSFRDLQLKIQVVYDVKDLFLTIYQALRP